MRGQQLFLLHAGQQRIDLTVFGLPKGCIRSIKSYPDDSLLASNPNKPYDNVFMDITPFETHIVDAKAWMVIRLSVRLIKVYTETVWFDNWGGAFSLLLAKL